MRVWVDITNSPHVPFFRPLLRLLRAAGSRGDGDGARVRADARAPRRTPVSRTRWSVPRHGGASAAGKARALAGRLRALRRFAKGARLRSRALARARTSCRCRRARSASRRPTPSTTSSRACSTASAAAQRRASSSPTRSRPAGSSSSARATARRVRYPGLKEEYYLAGLRARPGRPRHGSSSIRRACSSSCARRRTSPLYHRHGNPLFADVLERLGADPLVQAVVLPRTREQREAIQALGLPSLLVPDHARRRAEPRRARRPRRLGRRDDEPRGRGARHARLHRLRRPARGGRRAAPARRTPAAARVRRTTWSCASAGPAAERVRRDPARPPRSAAVGRCDQPSPRARRGRPRRSARSSPARRRRSPPARRSRSERRARSRRASDRGRRRTPGHRRPATARAATPAAPAPSATARPPPLPAVWRPACPAADPELGEEPARLPAPGHRQVAPGPRQPDVEEPALLVDVATPDRQLALVEPRQEDRVPLQPFRAVQGQQVHTRGDTRAEPALELGRELRDVVELLRDRDDPAEVALPRLLALTEIVRGRRLPAERERGLANDIAGGPARRAQAPEQRLAPFALEQRRPLERDARGVEEPPRRPPSARSSGRARPAARTERRPRGARGCAPRDDRPRPPRRRSRRARAPAPAASRSPGASWARRRAADEPVRERRAPARSSGSCARAGTPGR